jgi:mRNA-degrading endonuclease YafQ of YafQ-DinJ toxin-antitoxin module
MKSKYHIQATSRFQREYKRVFKKKKGLQKRFLFTVEKLSENPFKKGLRTHHVFAKDFGKVYSSRVTGDIRLICCFNGNIIVLQRIGGHSGSSNVYK